MATCNATYNYKDHVQVRRRAHNQSHSIAPFPRHILNLTTQVLNGFLAKADGKDKLTALVQVRPMRQACML